jgi:hypothetical protein
MQWHNSKTIRKPQPNFVSAERQMHDLAQGEIAKIRRIQRVARLN